MAVTPLGLRHMNAPVVSERSPSSSLLLAKLAVRRKAQSVARIDIPTPPATRSPSQPSGHRRLDESRLQSSPLSPSPVKSTVFLSTPRRATGDQGVEPAQCNRSQVAQAKGLQANIESQSSPNPRRKKKQRYYPSPGHREPFRDRDPYSPGWLPGRIASDADESGSDDGVDEDNWDVDVSPTRLCDDSTRPAPAALRSITNIDIMASPAYPLSGASISRQVGSEGPVARATWLSPAHQEHSMLKTQSAVVSHDPDTSDPNELLSESEYEGVPYYSQPPNRRRPPHPSGSNLSASRPRVESSRSGTPHNKSSQKPGNSSKARGRTSQSQPLPSSRSLAKIRTAPLRRRATSTQPIGTPKGKSIVKKRVCLTTIRKPPPISAEQRYSPFVPRPTSPSDDPLLLRPSRRELEAQWAAVRLLDEEREANDTFAAIQARRAGAIHLASMQTSPPTHEGQNTEIQESVRDAVVETGKSELNRFRQSNLGQGLSPPPVDNLPSLIPLVDQQGSQKPDKNLALKLQQCYDDGQGFEFGHFDSADAFSSDADADGPAEEARGSSLQQDQSNRNHKGNEDGEFLQEPLQSLAKQTWLQDNYDSRRDDAVVSTIFHKNSLENLTEAVQVSSNIISHQKLEQSDAYCSVSPSQHEFSLLDVDSTPAQRAASAISQAIDVRNSSSRSASHNLHPPNAVADEARSVSEVSLVSEVVDRGRLHGDQYLIDENVVGKRVLSPSSHLGRANQTAPQPKPSHSTLRSYRTGYSADRPEVSGTAQLSARESRLSLFPSLSLAEEHPLSITDRQKLLDDTQFPSASMRSVMHSLPRPTPIVEVVSADAAAAAKAAAILRVHHHWIHEGALTSLLESKDGAFQGNVLEDDALASAQDQNPLPDLLSEVQNQFESSDFRRTSPLTPSLANEQELAPTPCVPGGWTWSPAVESPAVNTVASTHAADLGIRSLARLDSTVFPKAAWRALDGIFKQTIRELASRRLKSSPEAGAVEAERHVVRELRRDDVVAAFRHRFELGDAELRDRWCHADLVRSVRALQRHWFLRLDEAFPGCLTPAEAELAEKQTGGSQGWDTSTLNCGFDREQGSSGRIVEPNFPRAGSQKAVHSTPLATSFSILLHADPPSPLVSAKRARQIDRRDVSAVVTPDRMQSVTSRATPSLTSGLTAFKSRFSNIFNLRSPVGVGRQEDGYRAEQTTSVYPRLQWPALMPPTGSRNSGAIDHAPMPGSQDVSLSISQATTAPDNSSKVSNESVLAQEMAAAAVLMAKRRQIQCRTADANLSTDKSSLRSDYPLFAPHSSVLELTQVFARPNDQTASYPAVPDQVESSRVREIADRSEGRIFMRHSSNMGLARQGSSFVRPTVLAGLGEDSHAAARLKATALAQSRGANDWMSPLTKRRR